MLSELDFVQWDRFVESEPGFEYTFYGWIDREKDDYKDFVILTYYAEGHFAYKECFSFTTSSAQYTHKISAIINGQEEASEMHNDCVRIEAEFPQLLNVVRLG